MLRGRLGIHNQAVDSRAQAALILVTVIITATTTTIVTTESRIMPRNKCHWSWKLVLVRPSATGGGLPCINLKTYDLSSGLDSACPVGGWRCENGVGRHLPSSGGSVRCHLMERMAKRNDSEYGPEPALDQAACIGYFMCSYPI